MNKEILNFFLKFDKMLMKLPLPGSISLWWNFGFMLFLFLMIQIFTGLFLSMHYTPHVNYAFSSVIHIMQDVNYGWLIRLMHMNGASFFFICVYIHIGRGLYYGSYKLLYTWYIGVSIFLFMMMIAFMGYILPWGQMSFWGATVITNLLTVLPYIGHMVTEWVWGSFTISMPTLNRFYTFHFFLPFILMLMVMIHLVLLHSKGSNNPLGLNSNYFKIVFHSYFTYKDLLVCLIILFMFIMIILEFPYILGDSENFLKANPMVTPVHIQPEWYFLFAYTILRSIPNKFSGVIALLMSIMILFILPMMMNFNFQSLIFYPISQMMFWLFFFNINMLMWLGMQPVDPPFIFLSQIFTFLYFFYYYIDFYLKIYWDKILII